MTIERLLAESEPNQVNFSLALNRLADWHLIIDGLAKPTFDGVLALPDLAGAIKEARAAALPDPRQAALKRKIAEIRARGAPDAA